LDWLEAFLWAVGMVLLINQYLFQAYQIPSGSMIDTLLISDRIFVNKIVYGPELLPGLFKITSPIKPKRNDIIIFENPSYHSQGAAFDLAQRILYMLTISLVDIDKDESGQPKAHFLIKRAVGMPGDIFVNDKGSLRVRYAGEDHFVEEAGFNAAHNYVHKVSRLMPAEAYPALIAAGKAAAWRDLGLNPPRALVEKASGLDNVNYPDYLTHEMSRQELLCAARPHEARYQTLLARYYQGWYVPPGRILPLGDNRDNSRDGRYFGPVKEAKILGQGAFKYWPPSRIGVIR
jgi:signal peptidase I